jgi:hypothetical protein
MANPDTITLTLTNPVDSITLSPVQTVDTVDVNTINAVTNISLTSTADVSTITVVDAQNNLNVELLLNDGYVPVQSVNTKIGNVVIDYSDINADSVNHVKYYHVQSSANSTWTIYHNLNFYPNVTVLNSSNQTIEADIQYLDANSVRIVMNASTSGKAYLS